MPYTPGPWHIGFADGSGAEEFWVVGAGDQAVVHGRGDCCHIGGIFEEANATLIAAAPDLLEALKAAWPYVPEHHGPVQHQIAAAIEKAEGRVK